MSNINHLNDEEIQAYALGDVGDPDISNHLNSCRECQLQLKTYQEIFSYIKRSEIPVPDLQIESAVLKQLAQLETVRNKDNRYHSLFIYIAIIILVSGGMTVWGSVNWIFEGSIPLMAMLAALLFSILMIMQAASLYAKYQKKISNIHQEILQPDFATVV